jgi:hypothetical protein
MICRIVDHIGRFKTNDDKMHYIEDTTVAISFGTDIARCNMGSTR